MEMNHHNLNQVQLYQVGYHAVVSNHYGNATSQIADLHVGNAPLISIARPMSRCYGSATQLSVEANGTGLWPISGIRTGVMRYDGTVLAFPNVQPTDEGIYEVTAGSPYGSVRMGRKSQIGRALVLSLNRLIIMPVSVTSLSVDANDPGRLPLSGLRAHTASR